MLDIRVRTQYRMQRFMFQRECAKFDAFHEDKRTLSERARARPRISRPVYVKDNNICITKGINTSSIIQGMRTTDSHPGLFGESYP
jgi:hypothetical protein